ncbi:MAG: hypothetical protein KAX11_06925, partial [Candidatus Aminicenantes bacterium]|nr:hypothetical protein [Candidatus Aminicenantes bacterium]
MKKQTIIALCVFLVFGLLQMVSFSAAETPKYEAGLTISTSKSTYQITENVRFILVKKTGVDDTPANLEGCYYIIQKKMDDDRWREFFTSDKNPFEITTLDLEKEFSFTWDQKDNERKHQAKPGLWRIQFFAPKGNIAEPKTAEFTIEGPLLRIIPKKKSFAKGETVEFKLKNNGDKKADLKECYYVIQYKKDTHGKEFYTSSPEPFDNLVLGPGKTKKITWNQKDNEGTHSAKPGQWRIIFHAPEVANCPV